MANGLISSAEITIQAPAAKVWRALVTPAAIKEYMFGTTVTSDWKEGSAIRWAGEWNGKPYEDRGTIQRFSAERSLQYTHFSPMSGKPDVPANYHTVTIDLSAQGGGTRVTLAQDNNATEQERAHSQKNWEGVLQGLKKYVESH